MLKVLGILDLAAATLFLANFYRIGVPHGLINLIAVFLVIKGLIFLMDISSIVDIAAGIILMMSLSAVLPAMASLPLALFVGFKGVTSLAAH